MIKNKSKRRGDVYYDEDGFRWTHVGTIMYDVKRGNRVVIPAGTKGVAIAYRQGPFMYEDQFTGEMKRVNRYKVRNKVF